MTSKRIQDILSYGWTQVGFLLYLGLGLTLVVAAFGGLGKIWANDIIPWMLGQGALDVLGILDQFLLISMLAEILQMVKISIRQRHLSSEPFLVVGLISVVRRVLIITAEGTRVLTQAATWDFVVLMAELAILAVLLFAFVRGIYLLRQQRLEEARRLREEQRKYGEAPTWAQLLQGDKDP